MTFINASFDFGAPWAILEMDAWEEISISSHALPLYVQQQVLTGSLRADDVAKRTEDLILHFRPGLMRGCLMGVHYDVASRRWQFDVVDPTFPRIKPGMMPPRWYLKPCEKCNANVEIGCRYTDSTRYILTLCPACGLKGEFVNLNSEWEEHGYEKKEK